QGDERRVHLHAARHTACGARPRRAGPAPDPDHPAWVRAVLPGHGRSRSERRRRRRRGPETVRGHPPRTAGRGALMPRREDIPTILIVGSGPIVIGQACEFDYSGTQACRVLRSEGYRVVLVNSNPATIITDLEFGHR